MWELPYSADRIKVVVAKGAITLEGDVKWNYQKKRAEEAVRRIKGVRAVVNTILIKPKATPSDIKRRIEEAFRAALNWMPIVLPSKHPAVKSCSGNSPFMGRTARRRTSRLVGTGCDESGKPHHDQPIGHEFA